MQIGVIKAIKEKEHGALPWRSEPCLTRFGALVFSRVVGIALVSMRSSAL